jgi:hypothetical protein
MKPLVPFIVMALASVAAGAATSTTPLKPGDTIVYERLSQAKISGGNLPAQAYKAQPVTDSTTTITVKSVGADGSAVVHVTVHSAVPKGQTFSSVQTKAYESIQAGHEFDATLTPWRALRINVDVETLNGPPLTGSLAQMNAQMIAQGNDPAYRSAQAALEAKGFMLMVNAVADGCAKRTSFATGDTWHVIVKPEGTEYDFAVTGRERFNNHNVVVLSAKYDYANSGGDTKMDGIAYFDPDARIVGGTHDVTVSTVKYTGMINTTTTDTTLKE